MSAAPEPSVAGAASGQPWLLDEPIQVGRLRLRGRVYVPAHQPGLAEGGRPGERYIAYQRARARAGVAMQVTGATPIAPSRVWNDICLWNVDESIVPGYQRLADAVHEEGGQMLAQLAHPGPTELVGPDVLGPSRDFSEVNRQVVRPATAGQLASIVAQYAEAADRCRRGGLDGVEISMAHGLLLAAFLSPLHNHRDDEYGGSFERRLHLPIQVLDAVREALGPDLLLGIRLGVDDLVEGGIRPADAARVATALERAGREAPEVFDQRLRSLPGIGVWTSAEVRQRSHGDPDAVSFGDYHIAKDVGWALTGTPFDDAELEAFLEPWRPQRGRVPTLLGLAGLRRPRHGPRMSPRTHLPVHG
jgi:2,4-dienoyl-CoA reductase-like NADH-dependent reductase (Old Yellow Enzyme family)